MLTDEHILETLRITNKQATMADVDAARRFMRCFDCEDAETYAEAHQKILASMDIISNELYACGDDREAQQRVLRQRYAKL